jgi:hypothetical protein
MIMQAIHTKKILHTLFVGLTLIVVSIALAFFITGKTTHAAPVVGFDPGNIISENIFTNSQSMTAAQIQSFLNSKVPSCDTTGTLRATEYGRGDLTHAQYAAMKGWSAPPYTCLKDYSENGKVSAQIIYDAAQEFNINPQVLIVLLQKEQSLVTDTWPISVQYQSATGYGCPDTAPCDSQYYGLTNQIRWSARMFRAIMNNSPTWYTPYVLGNNYIQYSPTTSCGGSTVNITNRSTQALYNYTPYQPNQDSLNAGYGDAPGDCDSHGNRNFYLYFSDWFGSPVYGNLVRTVDNSSVYLVSGDTKYPISDMNTFGALYPLGDVTFVNQSYLDTKTTGSILGRVIRSSDGTVYFFDAGMKLSFSSCAQVESYGSSCGQAQLLEDSQIRALSSGPPITSLFGTTSGKLFYISGGQKHEVYDNTALSQAGITDGANVLNEPAISYIPYGSPITRSDTVITSRQDSSKQVLNTGGQTYPIKVSSYTAKSFSPLASKPLDDQSIAKITTSASVIDDSIVDEHGNMYVLTSDGKKAVPDPSSFQYSPVQLSSSLISQLSGSGSLSNPSLLKTADNGTVYVVVNGQKRPLVAMEDLKSITGEDSPYIGWMSGGLLNAIPTGNIIVGAGRMVKTPSNGTVYMTDGYDKLITMSSFGPSGDLGLTASIRTISDDILSKYTVDTVALGSYVSCGGTNYIGMSGVIYPLTIPGLTARVLQTQSCNVLTKNTTLPKFVLTPNGTIFQLSSGVIHPISNWSTYVTLSAGGGAIIGISYSTALLLPTGAAI